MTGLVTQRDLAMVAWLGRFPFLTVDLLHRWVRDIRHEGRSVSIVYARLKVLDEAGLIDTAAVLAGAGRAVWLTAEGLKAAGVSGRSIPPRVGTFEHDLWVAQLATSIVITRPTHTLITEREMRSADTANQYAGDAPSGALTYASARIGGGSASRVYPDLITVSPSGARVVHEVERTGKDHRRLVRLMLAHLENDSIAQVRYYAPRAVITRVRTAAETAQQIGLDRGYKKPLNCIPWEEVEL